MHFEISSQLRLTHEELAGRFTMRGVNRELSPFVRMTVPAEWADIPIARWPTGTSLFTSWILLFGVLPVDRHRFCLRSVDDEGGFDEVSSSIINRSWRHRRLLSWAESDVTLTDRVDFTCRLPLMGHLLLPVYRAVFVHRHRMLRALWLCE